MAAIAANAELGVDAHYTFRRLQHQSKHLALHHSVFMGAVRDTVVFSQDADGDGVVDSQEGALLIVLTETGVPADLLSKYRPPCPIVVVTPSTAVARQTNSGFAQYPFI